MTQAVRQTRTHIAELLARRGLTPRHDLGQNFLIDLNLVEYLVAQAELGPEDVVFEVGSGTGGLTALLARDAGAVITVEVDPRLRELAAEALDRFSNVILLGCDVLKNKNHFAQPVLEALDTALSVPSRRLKLVANLPYCIGTPVVSNLVASSYDWARMVVTIQLELARRMMAAPGSADYGALSVWLQAQCRIELLKRLPPEVFWPRPKVESAMIRIDPDPKLRGAIRDRAFLREFVRAAFSQRRKLLHNVLSAALGPDLSREEIDAVLQSHGIGGRARAEELSPAKLVALCNAFEETIRKARGEDRRSSATA